MTSLAIPLRGSIDRWAGALRDTSALTQLTRSGGLTPRALAYYLTSLRYLLAHSERHLKLAAEVAEALGDHALHYYFACKLAEEQGHAAWATEDLSTLPPADAAGLSPSPWIVRLVELQRALIERHPICFLVYAVWAEYFTVLVGEAWIDALANSGFQRSQLSAVANHVDADREHAARGFDELDRLWRGQPERAELLRVVEEAASLFDGFCDDVCAQACRAA